ncbi:hypothetical protein CIW83_03145 [Tissierella sp. P1]|uniref:hypothetical protein n=1 Tax=Tissierella sp. P1 TaxID=1280483 RepID=UPI000BA00D4E|nr:hypothetical protein [Tissierella sp. P1]OZV13557.1 hypothetical protein CIW83_03145 [Tissierella sp. P1]
MFQEYPDIMNFKQFRKALGLGKNKAYFLLQSNQVEHFFIGTNYKIPKMCVVNYVKQQIQENSQS